MAECNIFKALGLFYAIPKYQDIKCADGTTGGSVCIVLYAKFFLRT